MDPLSPTLVNFILGVLGVAGTFTALWLARRGKREETKQQAIKQEFEQQNSAFSQISALADRYKQDAVDARREADDARTRESRSRDEWEARWSRQMDRCRRVTDAAAATITNLLGGSADRAAAEETQQQIREHNVDDHQA